MFHLKYVHSTLVLVRASTIHAQANTALQGHYCSAEAGHSTVLYQNGKKMQRPTRKKLPLVKEESLKGQQRLFSPLLVSISVSRSILGTNSRVCLLFTVLVLDFRREIRKPVHCIKWKTLIWLSVSETALGSRRKKLLHCQMPQENPLPKPSKKILC